MIHVFIGTKAQLIKMAPIMREMQTRGIEFNYIASGQHKETIDDLIACFGLKQPDVVLYEGPDITGIAQMLGWSLRIVLKSLFSRKKIFRDDRNGVILIHGDTFSTLLGAMVGRLSGLRVAHIESGLRSFNLFHPFPEEITRLMVFRLSHYYFAPGEWAMKNLSAYSGTAIDTETNTLSDSLAVALKNFDRCSVAMPKEKYAVASIHRFENIFDRERLTWIVDELLYIAETMPLLFILHIPTKKKLEKFGLLSTLESCSAIELRPRYDYLNFIKLVNFSEFVVSDGGSNQEECSYLGKPCLLFREKTERQEGIGENVLLSRYQRELVDKFLNEYEAMGNKNAFPQKSPSSIVVEALEKYAD